MTAALQHQSRGVRTSPRPRDRLPSSELDVAISPEAQYDRLAGWNQCEIVQSDSRPALPSPPKVLYLYRSIKNRVQIQSHVGTIQYRVRCRVETQQGKENGNRWKSSKRQVPLISLLPIQDGCNVIRR